MTRTHCDNLAYQEADRPSLRAFALALVIATLSLVAAPRSARAAPGVPAASVPGPTTVICADCPRTRLADAQKALDDGLRTYQRGIAENDARAYGDAVGFFQHGFAQSSDPVFLMHEANIELWLGDCAEGQRSFGQFMQLERRLKRFPNEAKRMLSTFSVFSKECAWQGPYAPKAVEGRLRAFAQSQAGKIRRVRLGPDDMPLRIRCPLGVNCDHKADSRMLGARYAGLSVDVFFSAAIVGQEASADLAAAFLYVSFHVLVPELDSMTWKFTGDSFKFVMHKGDPRIRKLTYQEGLLHIEAVGEMTELQASSAVNKCAFTKHPKECNLQVPARIPLEIELSVPIETGPLNCKDPKTLDSMYRCG